MCGLARFVTGLAVSAAQTAATQWLERTLDDSVNRRLTLPQAFLAADGVLRLALNVGGGLVVNTGGDRAATCEQTLPYMATENVLMAAVAAGGDRQELHEAIRRHSQAATARLKAGAADNDLLERLQGGRCLRRRGPSTRWRPRDGLSAARRAGGRVHRAGDRADPRALPSPPRADAELDV